MSSARLKFLNFLFKPIRSGNISYIFGAYGVNNIIAESKISVSKGTYVLGDLKVGKYSSFGINCFFRGDIEIGNYTQLGACVSIHTRNHPIDYLTTYQKKTLFNGKLKELRSDEKVTIGSDVWIGHGAIILQGLKIGNGAIIAAGAVVTKDVDDFAIVAGVPAKLIKYRFNDKQKHYVNSLKWWLKDPQELNRMKDLFFMHKSEFGNV